MCHSICAVSHEKVQREIKAIFIYQLLFIFFNFILFLNLHNCISFAKYQNELAFKWFMESQGQSKTEQLKCPVSIVFFLLLYITSGEGSGTPLQYSCLENPMDGGAWWAALHGVAKSRTRLSDFTFTYITRKNILLSQILPERHSVLLSRMFSSWKYPLSLVAFIYALSVCCR